MNIDPEISSDSLGTLSELAVNANQNWPLNPNMDIAHGNKISLKRLA
jgi:hypothetical protein